MLEPGGSGAQAMTQAPAGPCAHAARDHGGGVWVGLLTMLGALAPPPAHAEWQPTAQLRFASSYVYHGYDKSDEHPVGQLHGGLVHDSGLYGGVWLTELDFGGARLEANPYFGLQRRFGPDLRVDATVEGYVYDADVFGQDADYPEIALGIDWRGVLSARLSAALDTYGSDASTVAGEIKGRYPITDVCDASVSLGVDSLARVTGYDVAWWSAGVSYFLGRHVVADLRYVDKAYFIDFGTARGEARFGTAEMDRRALFSLSVGF